jgi:hypothetical protein
LLIRDASLYKLELSDVAADPSSVLHSLIPRLLEVHEKQQSVMSQRSMMLAFGIVIGIQILGIALPIRFLGGLAQQSPIANQVGRLDVLLLRGAYMSRDLIVKDKLSALFMVRCRLARMQLVETGVFCMIMLTYDAAWVQFTVGSGTKQQKLHGYSQCALFSRCHFTTFGSRSRPLSVAPIRRVVGNRIWQAG